MAEGGVNLASPIVPFQVATAKTSHKFISLQRHRWVCNTSVRLLFQTHGITHHNGPRLAPAVRPGQ